MFDEILTTDIHQIMDILESQQEVFLYDTVAVSLHELAFFKYMDLILTNFTVNHPLIITDTILTEMKWDEDVDGRYANYLKNFSKVLVVKERDFIHILQASFTPAQKAMAKFKKCSLEAFKTIQYLYQEICDLPSQATPESIYNLHDRAFPNGKNKGEYSLLWLSNVLDVAYPTLQKTFIGWDRDLYEIVSLCYFRPTLSFGPKIVSSETLLQALFRQGIQQNNLQELCGIHRNEQRKLIYRAIRLGLMDEYKSEDVFNNTDFLDNILKVHIEVIY